MTYQIKKNINRIELHDSHIIDFDITDNIIILIFDWAAVSDYKECNLDTLVLSTCKLELRGIKEMILNSGTQTIAFPITPPLNFPAGFNEILLNKSLNDNEITLSGFMDINGNDWIDWYIRFENFIFSWESHVTLEEWKNGALPH